MPELIRRTKKLDLLPTGSTLLNLACADSPFGGYGTGTIVNLVSDSDVGKSILAMTTLADIATKKAFDHYRLIYIAVEPLNFDIKKLFGERLLKRLEILSFETIEEVYVFLLKLYADRRAFVCVIDSYDALQVKEEVKKADKAAKRKEGPTKEDTLAGFDSAKKTKHLKTIMRQAKTDLPKVNGLLMVISQVIMNMEPGMFKPKHIVTGGQPIKHFPIHRIWLKPEKAIERRDRRIGTYVRAEVFKNHLTGKRREVVFPIFYDYGIDDLTSCVTFLVDEKYWKDGKDGIKCTELGFVGKDIAEVVKYIEDNNKLQEMYQAVTKLWNEIEEELKLNRKPRF